MVSGYVNCACCDDVIIGEPGELCDCCIEADCPEDGTSCEIPRCPACDTAATFCTDRQWHSNCDEPCENEGKAWS